MVWLSEWLSCPKYPFSPSTGENERGGALVLSEHPYPDLPPSRGKEFKKGFNIMNAIDRFLFAVSQSDNLKSKSGPADKNPKWVGFVTLAVAFALCGAVAQPLELRKLELT